MKPKPCLLSSFIFNENCFSLFLAHTSGIAKAYTLGPAFRADGDEGRRHLSEFHMLEAEMAFTNSIEDITMVRKALFLPCGIITADKPLP